MAAAVETKSVGTHQLTIEDDILFLRQYGDYILSDARLMNTELEAVLRRCGRAFVMVDQSQAGQTPPDSRRCIAEWNKEHQTSGSVVFGGSAISRAVATLVVNASRILNPRSAPIVFTHGEAEARAWIAARREKLNK